MSENRIRERFASAELAQPAHAQHFFRLGQANIPTEPTKSLIPLRNPKSEHPNSARLNPISAHFEPDSPVLLPEADAPVGQLSSDPGINKQTQELVDSTTTPGTETRRTQAIRTRFAPFRPHSAAPNPKLASQPRANLAPPRRSRAPAPGSRPRSPPPGC